MYYVHSLVFYLYFLFIIFDLSIYLICLIDVVVCLLSIALKHDEGMSVLLDSSKQSASDYAHTTTTTTTTATATTHHSSFNTQFDPNSSSLQVYPSDSRHHSISIPSSIAEDNSPHSGTSTPIHSNSPHHTLLSRKNHSNSHSDFISYSTADSVSSTPASAASSSHTHTHTHTQTAQQTNNQTSYRPLSHLRKMLSLSSSSPSSSSHSSHSCCARLCY